MGPAKAQLGLLVAVALLLSAGFLPLASAKGKGGAINPQVAGICARTPNPEMCKSTAGRHASKYPVIDVQAVLNMQVAAFAKRTAQARNHVKTASRTLPPAQTQALSFCHTMYEGAQDNIGAARRALTFKDLATTKIMLQLAVQGFQSCDRRFQQGMMPNPIQKFDDELNQMANNCMAIANMM